MSQRIAPLCPSLKKWLDEVSTAQIKIGAGGPNASVLSPAEAQMRNRDVVADLLVRSALDPAPIQFGAFDGPRGLTLNDLILLREHMQYMTGHVDANGMSEPDWQEFFTAEIGPAVERALAALEQQASTETAKEAA